MQTLNISPTWKTLSWGKKVFHQELASDKHKKNTIDKQGEEDEIVA
jgi:hypothetical protein